MLRPCNVLTRWLREMQRIETLEAAVFIVCLERLAKINEEQRRERKAQQRISRHFIMYHLAGITRKLQQGIWFANVISCIWERLGLAARATERERERKGRSLEC